MSTKRDKVYEITNAFTSGAVFKADDQTLREYLAVIIDADPSKYHASAGRFDDAAIGPMVHTILSIREERMVSAIERANARTQDVVKTLTYVAIVLAAIQAIAAVVAIWQARGD